MCSSQAAFLCTHELYDAASAKILAEPSYDINDRNGLLLKLALDNFSTSNTAAVRFLNTILSRDVVIRSGHIGAALNATPLIPDMLLDVFCRYKPESECSSTYDAGKADASITEHVDQIFLRACEDLSSKAELYKSGVITLNIIRLRAALVADLLSGLENYKKRMINHHRKFSREHARQLFLNELVEEPVLATNMVVLELLGLINEGSVYGEVAILLLGPIVKVFMPSQARADLDTLWYTVVPVLWRYAVNHSTRPIILKQDDKSWDNHIFFHNVRHIEPLSR